MKIQAVLIAILLAWAAFIAYEFRSIVHIVFAVVQGQDPDYDLGDGYVLWSGRHIVLWPDRTKDEPNFLPIKETIGSVGVNPNWIIGNTEKGWFAINKQSHALFYPVADKKELSKVVGIDVNDIPIIKDLLTIEIIRPWTPKAVFRTKIILVLLAAGPILTYVITILIFSRKSKPVIASE